MSDLQQMLDIFEKAKERGAIVNYRYCGDIDGSKDYISLYRHQFVFNAKGELIKSDATPLNDLDE